MVTYDSELFHLQERKRGYRAALEKHQLPAANSLIKEVDIKAEKGTIDKAIQELLAGEAPVDALLFGANNIAVAGLRYISTLSVKVPGDLAIVSFDETEALEFFMPPLPISNNPCPKWDAWLPGYY